MGVPRIFSWIVKKYPNTFLKGKFPLQNGCSYPDQFLSAQDVFEKWGFCMNKRILPESLTTKDPKVNQFNEFLNNELLNWKKILV